MWWSTARRGRCTYWRTDWGTAAEPDPVQHIGTSARFAPTAELRISIERDRFVVLSDRDVLILNLRSAAGLRCASGSPHPDAVDPVPLK